MLSFIFIFLFWDKQFSEVGGNCSPDLGSNVISMGDVPFPQPFYSSKTCTEMKKTEHFKWQTQFSIFLKIKNRGWFIQNLSRHQASNFGLQETEIRFLRTHDNPRHHRRRTNYIFQPLIGIQGPFCRNKKSNVSNGIRSWKIVQA